MMKLKVKLPEKGSEDTEGLLIPYNVDTDNSGRKPATEDGIPRRTTPSFQKIEETTSKPNQLKILLKPHVHDMAGRLQF